MAADGGSAAGHSRPACGETLEEVGTGGWANRCCHRGLKDSRLTCAVLGKTLVGFWWGFSRGVIGEKRTSVASTDLRDSDVAMATGGMDRQL